MRLYIFQSGYPWLHNTNSTKWRVSSEETYLFLVTYNMIFLYRRDNMKKTLLDGIWRLRADRIEDNKFAIKKGDEWDMAIPGDVHDTRISE